MTTSKNQDFTGILALIALELKTGRKEFEDNDEERLWKSLTINVVDSFIERFGDPGDHVDLREFVRAAFMQRGSVIKNVRKLYVDAAANRKAIECFYEQAHRLTSIFGIPFEVDHITPVSKGGKHHEENLQVVPWRINMAKFNKILKTPVWRDPAFSLNLI